ncbi:MAG: transglutaminase family protein [Candidatus Devosia euplotis]|nr:transglutaminase family protein [Candidatus Devosia euplotis]
MLHALMARVGEALGVDNQSTQVQMSGDGGQSQSQSTGTRTDGTPPTASALDIPARYVSGYVAAEPDGDDDLVGLHAWAKAYDEALGRIGFDPLLQICPSDRHVRLAVGLDELSATPLRI